MDNKFILNLLDFGIEKIRLTNPEKTDESRDYWTYNGQLGNMGDMLEYVLARHFNVNLESRLHYDQGSDITIDDIGYSVKGYGATICNDIFDAHDTIVNRFSAVKQYMARDKSDFILYGIIDNNTLTVYRLEKPFWQELLTYYASSAHFADIDGYKLRIRVTASKLERYLKQYAKKGTLFCGVPKRTH